MNEQRVQAYVELIEQLLIYPERQMDLLQANLELVDTDLLVIMRQRVVQLEQQGYETAAQWLLEFSAHLEKELGLGTENQTGNAHAIRFLSEILQLVAESDGNPERVYPIWEKQQNRLNVELLAVFPTVIMPFLEGNAEDREIVALILVRFGNLIQKFPWGERWLNLELGIIAYELALLVYTRISFQEQWATTQNNLAIAYADRIQGDRADNIEKAIAVHKLVLSLDVQVFKR